MGRAGLLLTADQAKFFSVEQVWLARAPPRRAGGLSKPGESRSTHNPQNPVARPSPPHVGLASNLWPIPCGLSPHAGPAAHLGRPAHTAATAGAEPATGRKERVIPYRVRIVAPAVTPSSSATVDTACYDFPRSRKSRGRFGDLCVGQISRSWFLFFKRANSFTR